MRFHLPRANPFAVDAWFDRSCTLTFAVPKEEIASRLPDCLVPDTLHDRWGFVAVAVVLTRNLRPSGFPVFLGNDFILVGYRFFVRYRSPSGRTLRGLYILRSETDRWRMELLGNLFTRYRYVKTDVSLTETADRLRIDSRMSGLQIELDLAGDAVLPAGSPFANWQEARRFSGPLPFTFTCEPEKRRVLIVEGVRSHWKPQPVGVVHSRIPFLEQLGFRETVLANAFMVSDVPYHWKKGRAEPWQPL